jgi:hypothetical protein
VYNTVATDTAFNALTADLATGLSTCITKDGQTTATAIIPFASGITLAGGDTLNKYAAGGWTPAENSGSIGPFTNAFGIYVKIGKLVWIKGTLIYPVNADGSPASISGLPFTAGNDTFSSGVQCTLSSNGTLPYCTVNLNTTTINLKTLAGANYQNANFSGGTITFAGCYIATS